MLREGRAAGGTHWWAHSGALRREGLTSAWQEGQVKVRIVHLGSAAMPVGTLNGSLLALPRRASRSALPQRCTHAALRGHMLYWQVWCASAGKHAKPGSPAACRRSASHRKPLPSLRRYAQPRRRCWQGGAQSRRRCGRGEPSPGADVASEQLVCTRATPSGEAEARLVADCGAAHRVDALPR